MTQVPPPQEQPKTGLPLPDPKDLPALPGIGLDILTLSRLLAASGYFQDARSLGQALAKVLAGMEMGIGPFRAMADIFIFTDKENRPRIGMHAGLAASLVKRSGRYNYRQDRLDDDGCTLVAMERAQKDGTEIWKDIGQVTFTYAEAVKAKLPDRNPTWNIYRQDMLFARTVLRLARRHCADVFGGPIYGPEERDELLEDVTPEATASAPVTATPAAPVAPEPPVRESKSARLRKTLRREASAPGAQGGKEGGAAEQPEPTAPGVADVPPASSSLQPQAVEYIDMLTALPGNATVPQAMEVMHYGMVQAGISGREIGPLIERITGRNEGALTVADCRKVSTVLLGIMQGIGLEDAITAAGP